MPALIQRRDLTYFADNPTFQAWSNGKSEEILTAQSASKGNALLAKAENGFFKSDGEESVIELAPIKEAEQYAHAVHDLVGMAHIAHAEGELDPEKAVMDVYKIVDYLSEYQDRATDKHKEYAQGIIKLAASFADACAQTGSGVPFLGDVPDQDRSQLPRLAAALGTLSRQFCGCNFSTPHIETRGVSNNDFPTAVLFSPEEYSPVLVVGRTAYDYDEMAEAVMAFGGLRIDLGS